MTPLVSAEWLASRGDDPAIRIADCRWYLADPPGGRRAYDAGHLPGATYVSLEDHLTADHGPGRHPLPSPSEFAEAMAWLGIGDEHTVVAYDDRGGAVAARLWWMLTALDHEAAVLDGGIQAWEASGGALTTEPPSLPPATFTTDRMDWPGIADRTEVVRRLGSVRLVDARSPERFRGETEPIDPVAGHVPGAVNLPYEGNLAPDGRFADRAALRRRYGDDPRETIVYCGSGVTACHDILAMEVAGAGRATLYPGSWSDWSSSGGAVATGDAVTPG